MFLLPFFVQIVFKLLEGLELIPHGCITSKSDIWGFLKGGAVMAGTAQEAVGKVRMRLAVVVHTFSTSAQEAEAGKD